MNVKRNNYLMYTTHKTVHNQESIKWSYLE